MHVWEGSSKPKNKDWPTKKIIEIVETKTGTVGDGIIRRH